LKQHYNTLLVTNIISSIHTLELEKKLKNRRKLSMIQEELGKKGKEKERNFERKKVEFKIRLQLRVLQQL